MSGILVARRYAKALFKLANDDAKKTEGYFQSLSAVSQFFEMDEARRILISPVMPNDLKFDILNLSLKKASAPIEIENYVRFVVEAGRVALFPEILKQIEKILDEKAGRTKGRVISAENLQGDQLGLLAKKLGERLSKKVDLTESKDPDLLGGFVVLLENLKIDLSLKTRIENLAHQANG